MSEWFDLVKKSETIALFTHINSDGDANGSVMAMYHTLKNLGKDVYVFIPTPINRSYWFTGSNKISCKRKLKSYDLAIALDCPNTKRFGQCETEFFKAKHSICIDHHLENANFADITFVDTDISSASELLWSLLEKEGDVKITKEIVTCLYLGIATDTGGFTHGSHGDINSKTWRAVANLTDFGADLNAVNYNIFNLTRKPVFELLKFSLANVEFYENGKIAMVCVPKRFLEEVGAELTDTHKFTDLLSGVEGVEIFAVMAGKAQNEQSVSVRSQKHSAQRICKSFGGGGHLKAAGCRLFVPFEVGKKQLLDECVRELYRND